MTNEEKLLDRIKKLEEENEILTREIKTSILDREQAKREYYNMYSNVKVLSSAFNIVMQILDKQYYELDIADEKIVNQAIDIIYPKYDL